MGLIASATSATRSALTRAVGGLDQCIEGQHSFKKLALKTTEIEMRIMRVLDIILGDPILSTWADWTLRPAAAQGTPTEEYRRWNSGQEALQFLRPLVQKYRPELLPFAGDAPHQTLNWGQFPVVEEAILHSQRLCQAAMDALDRHIEREVVIDRFISYITIYKAEEILKYFASGGPIKPEEQYFQPMFEEFLFYHGFFPLSQVRLGASRLDLLIHRSPGHVVLAELKTVGFSRSPASRILDQATIQAMQYRTQLSAYPGILPWVYILVFAHNVILLPEKEEIEISGIRYYIRSVNILHDVPSRAKSHILPIRNLIVSSP